MTPSSFLPFHVPAVPSSSSYFLSSSHSPSSHLFSSSPSPCDALAIHFSSDDSAHCSLDLLALQTSSQLMLTTDNSTCATKIVFASGMKSGSGGAPSLPEGINECGAEDLI
ncbi:uncharacterized protein N7469_004862 [Penicillium citrinum]|uniref:Uncharacterized protein n=2 Tax=Penicillium TaxID=5073 RepID=A0A9W9P5B9_PENCI|nr:uncharacterized protein N7469_004862 [Penicillium citrinum]KAJ5235694.1 hypothetical protein N7469_004862 [Penicillium citrinum]KAJ5591258.1 hypothetical protein N7450_005230 [Penicillium hetheringtonii]